MAVHNEQMFSYVMMLSCLTNNCQQLTGEIIRFLGDVFRQFIKTIEAACLLMPVQGHRPVDLDFIALLFVVNDFMKKNEQSCRGQSVACVSFLLTAAAINPCLRLRFGMKRDLFKTLLLPSMQHE